MAHDKNEKRLPPVHDMRALIGNTLRIGALTACLLAAFGGILYMVKHGGESMPDYTVFDATPDPSFTTLRGIFGGMLQWEAMEWIQVGVLALILTPVLRVMLSFFDFVKQRDWLYVTITAIVLSIILFNSIGGVEW